MKTKKQIILDLFDSIDWIPAPDGTIVKIISNDDFDNVGLYGCIENSQQFCDVLYAKRIIKKLGYRVLIGMYVFCMYDINNIRNEKI